MQDFEEADPNLLAINGSRLVRATKSVLSGRLKDDSLAEEVFNFVTFVLDEQKEKGIIQDEAKFNSVMKNRGKQRFIVDLEHVKRKISLCSFAIFSFQTLGETEFLRNTSAIRYMQF